MSYDKLNAFAYFVYLLLKKAHFTVDMGIGNEIFVLQKFFVNVNFYCPASFYYPSLSPN